MSSNRLKTNGARLSQLIIDQGTEIMRKFFDSIHPPDTLTAVLHSFYDTISEIRVIKPEQRQKLYPPSGEPSTSGDYDITLLFILIRNICGVHPPASTGSWNADPPAHDHSPEADLVRLKNFRNKVYGHISSTGVPDDDFDKYWTEISEVLVRLGADVGHIARLKTSPLDEDLYLNLLNEWYENDEKTQVRISEISRKMDTVLRAVDVHQLISSIILSIFAIFLLWGILSQFLPDNVSKKTDYFYFQSLSNPGFVGREWVFRQLEQNVSTASDVRGVLLVADPGWGKSEIMKRLINSPSSSPIIHENIIGHHFCKYNDESTRNGEKFVKGLVQSISKKIFGFKQIVDKDQLIKDELEFNCATNPEECFKTTIVEPLKKLDGFERKNSFILIDALDECLEKEERHTSIIPTILHSHVSDLPPWVKLIVSSRNQTLTTGKMSPNLGFLTFKINLTDPRNVRDLYAYAEQTLQSLYSELSTEKYFRLRNSIDLAIKSSSGNFLFLERILKYWQKYPEKINAQSIPRSLADIYAKFFAPRFTKSEFNELKPLLEVLVAADSPKTLLELDKILYFYDNRHYDTTQNVLKISEYFKSDIDKGPVEFHHEYFAEWLTNQADGSHGIVIEKSKGHKYIVDYLFNSYSERQTRPTLEELSKLCSHILRIGKLSLQNKNKLSSLNVSEIRGFFNRSILHYLARKCDAHEIIIALIKQFNINDLNIIMDGILPGWTKHAMIAVSAGCTENLRLFIDNAAKVNYAVEKEECHVFGYFNIDDSMSSLASFKGHLDIAQLLVKRGANIEEVDECGWKPLHWAAIMGHLEIVKLYINNGAQPDLIALHHAAARNHTEIVRLLLETGLRDKCLRCKTEVKLSSINVIQYHYCMGETALHAAVSKNDLKMAKLILRYGNTTVNCKHGGSRRTPLMEAFSRKNTEMVEVLINAGADINAECQSLMISNIIYFYRFHHYFYFYDAEINKHRELKLILYCYQGKSKSCNGSRVIDFAFAHGFWQVMIPFLSKEKLSASADNVRWSPATVAAIYDQDDFLNATYGSRIDSIPYIETVLRYAAVCHSVKTLRHLLNSGDLSKFTTVYEDGKTLLHLAILGSGFKTPALLQFSSSCVCPKVTYDGIWDNSPLETFQLLTKVLQWKVNKQDKYGRTALHYAAVSVLPEIVEYLVKIGANKSVEDQMGDNALEFALRQKRKFRHEVSLPCRWTSDKVFKVCSTTTFDEMTRYLLQNATIKKCDYKAKKILNGLTWYMLPLSLYELFKSGLDVNCAQEYFKRILAIDDGRRRRKTYAEILEVFKIFQINVEVLCDVPFVKSDLHLVASSTVFVDGVGNLFQPSRNGSLFPLERFFKSHPNGVKIFNECYDKEGYLAIHRAAQASNLHAVSWFIEIGVNVSIKTKSNLTALALSVDKFDENLHSRIEYRDRERIFDILLNKMQENNQAIFQCNSEFVDLSPLHVAASRGTTIMQIIHHKIPTIPLNCTNRDGIQPVYLAYLHHKTHPRTWRTDYQALKNLGLLSKYPQHEVEYHLIYNQYYRTPQEDLRNVLNHEYLFKCPGINELLPHRTVIQEIMKLKGCTARCWPSVLAASRDFSTNFPYLKIQSLISNPFTDKFIDIAHYMAELRFYLVKSFYFNSKLWRKVTNAHSCAHTCSCFEIMQFLQIMFTSKPRKPTKVGKFVAERMGWTDTSDNGDVKYRWPFSFLLKKALRTDKTYEYLEILSSPYDE